jgi:molecular chaperone DnaJ
MNVFGEDIRIRIEPNTENGKILRLKGKGLPSREGSGDLYLHLNIYVPKDLDYETINHLKIIKDQINPQNHEISPQTGFLNKALKINSLYSN